MSKINTDSFYRRLEEAPYAVLGFFESVKAHFDRDNIVECHHTETNGGDLRLAIPGEVLGQKSLRNFSTMYWQKSKHVIFARTFLTVDELVVLGFNAVKKPVGRDEPLNSEVRLSEDVWRFGAREFIRALDMAKVKFLETREN